MRARRISRRSGSTSSARVARSLAAASCSMIGVPRSMEGRMAAMVASALGSARIQPMRSPPQNDFDIEPTVSTRSRPRASSTAATGAGTGSSSHMSVMVSSMMVRVRVSEMMSPTAFGPPRAATCRSDCGCRGSDRPGWAPVGAPRRASRRDPSRRCVIGTGTGAGACGADGRQRPVIGGLLDEHPVAGLGVGGQDQPDRVLRTAGDHDLVGVGGKSSRAISFGDRGREVSDSPVSS